MAEDKNGVEILAPAGNLDMLKAAVYAGASAVYLGYAGFNARKTASGFCGETLKAAVSFCRGFGVKVYVALNTVVFSSELSRLAEAASDIAQSGADAVILQDLAAAEIIRKTAPELALHGSTQMAVYSLSGALKLAEMGFKRVILARELSRGEIEFIIKNCGIETEIFIHGALCMGVSGQCYLSAFLGGRSGNRGECAGPCRLPFTVCSKQGEANEKGFHLSLKDLSIINNIKDIASIGVSSVKIEGRLRSEEYVAAAVNACRMSLCGKPYDEQLLREVFSRSGFTNAYYENRRGKDMFGVRAPEDSVLTKKAQPKLREIYRRPVQSVGVDMEFKIAEDKIALSVSDGQYTARLEKALDMPPAENEAYPQSVRASLEKTGGTPFFARKITLDLTARRFAPLGEINAMRKTALEELLEKREKIPPVQIYPYALPKIEKRQSGIKSCSVRAEKAENLPDDISRFKYIYLPLSEDENLADEYKEKAVLELPRCVFGDDTFLIDRVKKACGRGFTAFQAQNISHFYILQKCGVKNIHAGFTMNVLNDLSARALRDMGAVNITVSPESSLENAAFITGETSLIAYGHLPLMVTRACPRHNIAGCGGCPKQGEMIDRKQKRFKFVCGGGIRTIYNPVALYMGERVGEMPCDNAVLYFTTETKQQANAVCDLFFGKKPLGDEFTRGLYYK